MLLFCQTERHQFVIQMIQQVTAVQQLVFVVLGQIIVAVMDVLILALILIIDTRTELGLNGQMDLRKLEGVGQKHLNLEAKKLSVIQSLSFHAVAVKDFAEVVLSFATVQLALTIKNS